MAAKPCDLWHHRWGTFWSSWIGGHACKISPRSVPPFQRRFFLKKNNGCWATWPMTSSFFCINQFIPRWPSKIFILIGYSVLHMQLWCHTEGTDDIIKSLIPHVEYLTRATFQFFFNGAVSEIQRSNASHFFPTWLPYHVTYDIIINIKTFYVSIRTNGENFLSIRQAVPEKRG